MIKINLSKTNEVKGLIQQLKEVIKRGHQYDVAPVLKQIESQPEQVSKLIDCYDLISLTVYLQQLSQQECTFLYPIIKARIISQSNKATLLKCLQLRQHIDENTLKTIPNQSTNLLDFSISRLLQYDLNYRESTAILSTLYHYNLLNELKGRDWVQQLIHKTQEGISNTDMKNIAMLSRIYKQCSHKLLTDVADKLNKLPELPQKNNRSYVTLYHAFSEIDQQELRNKISKAINQDKCQIQDLIQLQLGAIKSLDQFTATWCHRQLKTKQLNAKDRKVYLICATQFSLLSKQEAENIKLQELDIKSAELGQLCLNLLVNYQINQSEFIKSNPQLIDEHNIINLYYVTMDPGYKIKIVQFMQDRKIDFAGILKAMTFIDLQEEIYQLLNSLTNEQIQFHLSEISLIALGNQAIINETLFQKLIDAAVNGIKQNIINIKGLGNLYYLAALKHCLTDIKYRDRLLKETTGVENHNVIKLFKSIGLAID